MNLEENKSCDQMLEMIIKNFEKADTDQKGFLAKVKNVALNIENVERMLSQITKEERTTTVIKNLLKDGIFEIRLMANDNEAKLYATQGNAYQKNRNEIEKFDNEKLMEFGSRSLLLTASKKIEEEKKELKILEKADSDKFLEQLSILQQICGYITQLNSIGHFKYRKYEGIFINTDSPDNFEHFIEERNHLKEALKKEIKT